MAVGVQQAFSVTASSNGSADTNINYAEGQSPASLNDASRGFMAAVKGWANQIGAAKTSGGSANAQTFTSDSVAAITSYAAGRLFCFKAGYTNTTTTPTFNVDGVGAKTIKKGGAQAALAAGDITAGGIYWIAYEASGDCFLLLNPDTGSISSQPLDATTTALAALSWSSGNALVQFTAADTVSLTLTPSVSSVTASQGAANTTPSGTFVNTTDSASVLVARFDGDRATPANNDTAHIAHRVSNGSGTQTEIARTAWRAVLVAAGGEFGQLRWSTIVSGALTDQLALQAGNIFPVTNDGVALGLASLAFSDAYFATGAVLGFGNGNFALTHETGGIAASGFIEARVPLSSETSGTLTVASANRKVACSGNITLDDGVFTTDDFVLFDPGTSSRTFTRASGLTMYVNGTDSASATLAANQIGAAHWRSSTVVVLSGAFS